MASGRPNQSSGPSLAHRRLGRPARHALERQHPATILVTLVVVLGINTIGIVLRNRLEKKK